MIDEKAIRDSLSNFYKEYSYPDSGIDFFLKLFQEMGQAVDHYLTTVQRDQTIKSMEAFKRYNFAAFRAHGACYKIEELLADASLSAIFPIGGSTEDKIKAWTTFESVNGFPAISDEQRVEFLEKAGKGIQLSAKRVLDDVEPRIVSLNLFDMQKRQYTHGFDFILSNNKIYLFGQVAVPSVDNSSLIATQVYVDYDSPNRLIGSRIGIGYNENISKPEYRDFIQMVSYVLIKGPTVKNIRDSFNLLAGWENSDVIDYVSAKGVRRELWTNTEGGAILTPFDFLVTIPARSASTVGLDAETEEMIVSDDRIQIFQSFLDVVKPTDTGYVLALSELIPELIPPDETFILHMDRPLSESVPPTWTFDPSIKLAYSENFYHGDIRRKIAYDDGKPFDDIYSYDRDSLEPLPGTSIEWDDDLYWNDNYSMNEDSNMYGDIIKIQAIEYPQFPVSFTATRNVISGNVVIAFIDNAEDISAYEVFRNGVLKTTIASPGGLNAPLSWTDTEIAGLGSGTYTYYAKSIYFIGETKYSSRQSKSAVIIK